MVVERRRCAHAQATDRKHGKNPALWPRSGEQSLQAEPQRAQIGQGVVANSGIRDDQCPVAVRGGMSESAHRAGGDRRIRRAGYGQRFRRDANRCYGSCLGRAGGYCAASLCGGGGIGRIALGAGHGCVVRAAIASRRGASQAWQGAAQKGEPRSEHCDGLTGHRTGSRKVPVLQ